VNPGAAEAAAKPKVQVAKKANILSQLPPQAENSSQPASRPQAQPVQQTKAQARQADDDLGIIRMERGGPARQQSARGREPSPPQAAHNPMIPKQSVQLRSRAERDESGGAQTAGQARAAKELEKIKREQTRTVDCEAGANATPSASRRHSNASSVNVGNEPANMEELLSDLMKMKQVLRQHERRIRVLEDAIAEANMSSAYGL